MFYFFGHDLFNNKYDFNSFLSIQFTCQNHAVHVVCVNLLRFSNFGTVLVVKGDWAAASSECISVISLMEIVDSCHFTAINAI